MRWVSGCVCGGGAEGVIVLKLVAKVKEGRGVGRRGEGEGRTEAGRRLVELRQVGGQADGQDLCLSMCNTNVALDEMDSDTFLCRNTKKKK